jgi:two-component system OmpR family sensor kinase/two-component system sensor histidine kinase QseC
MTSLRRFAMIWWGGVLAAMSLVSAAGTYYFVAQEADDALDEQLKLVASYVGADPEEPAALDGRAFATDPEDELVLQFWRPDGSLAGTSHPEIAIPRQANTGFADIRAADDSWRTFTLTGSEGTIQVSQRMVVREELAGASALRSAVPIGLLVPIALLALGFAIDRIMRRLDRVAGLVAERSLEDRSPIPLQDTPIEIAPLLQAMNSLMSRLNQEIERQKRFVSDAAHELRTPLTALQIQIDNLKRAAQDGPAPERLAELEDGVRRSAALVEQLLRLARYEAGEANPPAVRFDLAACVAQCVARATLLADRRRIDLGLERLDAADILGSADDMAVLIGNLLDNAIRYTAIGRQVDVSLAVEPGVARIDVTDTGPGVDDASLPRLFDRFYRARPHESSGTGLGLAIAKLIADRHKAQLDLRNRSDRRGMTASLVVPLAQSAAP